MGQDREDREGRGMTDLDRLHQVFDQELASDMATERAISRRCIYAMLIVIGLLVARTVWFV